MKFKTKNMIATVIILFISGSAFLAGFLQEYYSGQAADLREKTTDLQTALDRMETKALFIYQADRDITINMEIIRMEANLIDIELSRINDSLSNNERDSYITQVAEALFKEASLQQNIFIRGVYNHFFYDEPSKLWDYLIATKAEDGYDFTISWDMWQSFEAVYGASPVDVRDALGYYGYMFSFDLIQDKPLESRPNVGGQEIFILPGYGGVDCIDDYFLFDQVRTLQDEINKKLSKVEDLETQASRIGLGVAMTTVGVVLSTAMANRLNQRKIEREFEKIREKEERLAKRDLISIPVLVIAIILSLLGVIFPLFLNLFG